MEKSRKRLTLNERVIIQTLLGENRTKSYIAAQLNRSRSSITREVNNWIKKLSIIDEINTEQISVYYASKIAVLSEGLLIGKVK